MLEDLALNESVKTVPLGFGVGLQVGLVLSPDSVPLCNDLGDLLGMSVEF